MLCTFLCLSPALKAQGDTVCILEYGQPSSQDFNTKIYETVEQKAEFPGGMAAMYEWIEQHLQYPKEALKEGIEGRVFVRFTVRKDGSITDTKVIRSLDPLCDAEALRLVGTMPKWKPGRMTGIAVNSYYVLPIQFRLNTLEDTNISSNTTENPADSSVQKAEFPGGFSAMRQWLAKNLKYPEEAKKRGISGRVVVRFRIMRDGSVANVKIARSLDSLCDAEALRVVRSMPRWKPGNFKGIPVTSSYILPVTFRFSGTGKIVSTATGDSIQQDKRSTTLIFDDNTYGPIETRAEFPGGMSALEDWLNKHLQYPEEARKKKVEGRVFVRFKVLKDGSITNLKVTRNLDPDCDAEALRLVGTMPKWIPGRFMGNPNKPDGVIIESYYVLPIQFKLPANEAKDTSVADEDSIYMAVDQVGQFPGGHTVMLNWLAKNLKYPKEALKKKIEGRVFVRFVVRKDGRLTDAKIIRSLDPLCDAEVLRIIGLMPKWEPALKDGKPVNFHMTLPVQFKLPK